MADRITYTPSEAAEALGLSRSKTYELIAKKELPSLRFGGRVLVPADALRELITTRATTESVAK